MAELAGVRRPAPTRAAKFPKQPDLGDLHNLEAVFHMVYNIWLICIVETLRRLRLQIGIRSAAPLTRSPASTACKTATAAPASGHVHRVVRVNTTLLRKWRRAATKPNSLQDLMTRRHCSKRRRLLSRYSSSLESIAEE
jgi:hypothetical protein